LYLAVAVDGNAGGYVILYSPTGGVDIEQSETLVRFPVGAPEEFQAHALRDALAPVEEDISLREKVLVLARRLLDVAAARDCTTIEINPLFLMPDGSLLAADAKVVRDDSAAWRQADIAERLAEEKRVQPKAIRAALEGSLMLVWLEGEVGLISGGAGMTMAAMDLIAEAGGRPACFLDCSSNPTPDGYRLAFSLLDSEPRVKSILVAVFGGGTHVDRVARTMRDILKERRSRKPVFFRLNGTNVDGVPAVFEPAGLHNHATLEDAVTQAVAAVGGKR
jgi:succinyl-CoA synthetase beta subunit